MKIIKKILFAIISLILGLLLSYNIYNLICTRVLKKDISTVNGYAVLEVVSGSMEPTINVYDMIIIDTKVKDYHSNDIVTFYDEDGSFITHRIISIKGNKVITKGDNNNSEDDPITTDRIVGKYQFKINGAGKILSAFKSPFTMIMIFVVGLLVCILLSTDKKGNAILDEKEKRFLQLKAYLKYIESKNQKK